MPKHINQLQIFIDSKNKSNPSNFTYGLTRVLLDVYSIELESCSIPIEFWAFRSGKNEFRITDSGGSDITVTITPGNYTSTTILTELKTRLEVASIDTYTITHSDSTNKITIVSSNAAFVIEGATTTNSCLDLIGWPNLDTTAAASKTGPNVIRLYDQQYLYLKSNELASNSYKRPLINGIEKAIFAKIPIDQTYGSVVSWKSTLFGGVRLKYMGGKDLGDIDIQLLYEDESEVDLNGASISLTLVVNYD